MAKGGGLRFPDEVKRREVAKAASSKPHIDDVMLLFHAYRTEGSRIMRAHKPMSIEMVRAFDAAKLDLKAKMAAIGLADLIEWRDR